MAKKTINITLPKNALLESIEFHSKRTTGDCFAALQPIIRIECEGRELTESEANGLYWRISDLEEGWMAGVLGIANGMDGNYENRKSLAAQSALSLLINSHSPQPLYPTLSNLCGVKPGQEIETLSIPTSVILGDWGRNMDAFIVGQELREKFTHGWGEPTVRDFQDTANGRFDHYL